MGPRFWEGSNLMQIRMTIFRELFKMHEVWVGNINDLWVFKISLTLNNQQVLIFVSSNFALEVMGRKMCFAAAFVWLFNKKCSVVEIPMRQKAKIVLPQIRQHFLGTKNYPTENQMNYPWNTQNRYINHLLRYLFVRFCLCKWNSLAYCVWRGFWIS